MWAKCRNWNEKKLKTFVFSCVYDWALKLALYSYYTFNSGSTSLVCTLFLCTLYFLFILLSFNYITLFNYYFMYFFVTRNEQRFSSELTEFCSASALSTWQAWFEHGQNNLYSHTSNAENRQNGFENWNLKPSNRLSGGPAAAFLSVICQLFRMIQGSRCGQRTHVHTVSVALPKIKWRAGIPMIVSLLWLEK